MVDAVSSQGGIPAIQPSTGQTKPPAPSVQSGAAPPKAPSDTNAAAGSGSLDGLIDSDLTKDQAVSQSQAAGQQLADSNLSIANRSPQALANALPG